MNSTVVPTLARSLIEHLLNVHALACYVENAADSAIAKDHMRCALGWFPTLEETFKMMESEARKFVETCENNHSQGD
jgi:hypothetical protein